MHHYRSYHLSAHVAALAALVTLTRPPTAAGLARPEVAPSDRVTVSTCEMAIKFVTPEDWRCRQEDGCTICHNHTDHSSELLTRCLDATTAERSRVHAGATLSICAGAKGPALDP